MAASSGSNRNKNLKPTYRKSARNRAEDRQAREDEKREADIGVSDEGHKEKPKGDVLGSAKPEKTDSHEAKGSEGDDRKDLQEHNDRNGKEKSEGSESVKPESDNKRSTGKHGAHAKEPNKKETGKGKADDKKKKSAEGNAREGKTAEEKAVEEKAAEGKAGSRDKLLSMPRKRRPLGPIIGGAVAAVLIIACVAFGISGQGSNAPTPPAADSLRFSDTAYNDAGELVNQVDWDAWTSRNPDVYAWLQIDGTNVDYPILQHPVVDDYYLMRNIDGEPEVNGTLYTQVAYNTKDFEEDPVTIIYGHTFEKNDTMFTTLHNLENHDFFDSTPTFYIYTPEKRLEYEIVSAFEYDNSHILQTQDMSDMQVRSAFFDMVQNPDSLTKNVRELENKLNPSEDNLLILSTCTQPANDNARYLVAAVLKKAESTEDVEMSEDSTILEEHTMTQEELDALADVE